jgi:hypothetical protein
VGEEAGRRELCKDGTAGEAGRRELSSDGMASEMAGEEEDGSLWSGTLTTAIWGMSRSSDVITVCD